MVMFDGLQTARAWDMLHDQNVVGGLDTEGYLDLCMAAGYPKDVAQKAANEWANKRLSKDLPI